MNSTAVMLWFARNWSRVSLAIAAVSGWVAAARQEGMQTFFLNNWSWAVPTACVFVAAWAGWAVKTVHAIETGETVPDAPDDEIPTPAAAAAEPVTMPAPTMSATGPPVMVPAANPPAAAG